MNQQEASQPQYEIKIKEGWCKGCGICTSFCPRKNLFIDEKGKVHSEDPPRCIGCGLCESNCPDYAITVRRKGQRDPEPKLARASSPVRREDFIQPEEPVGENLVPKVRLLQGNEACAEGAIAAGVRFFAGYPITPSTEIAEKLADLLPRVGGKFIQMEDEIASLSAVLGASLTGVKAITATSGPGFSLMQENIGFAAMGEIPCVIVNVQRFGPSTGMPTAAAQGDVMQARWGTHGDHPVVVLTPASVEETYHLTVKAVNISEELRIPVILLMDEVIGHMREKVTLPELDLGLEKRRDVHRPRLTVNRELYVPYRPEEGGVPPLASFGHGMRFHVTGLAHDETGFPTNDAKVAGALVTRLNRKVSDRSDKLAMAEEYMLDDARLALVAYGGMARAARKAVKMARSQGLPVGMLRLITLWPFPEKYFQRLSPEIDRVLVPEMNFGQVKLEVDRVNQGRRHVAGMPKVDGELFTPEELLARIKEEVAAICSVK